MTRSVAMTMTIARKMSIGSVSWQTCNIATTFLCNMVARQPRVLVEVHVASIGLLRASRISVMLLVLRLEFRNVTISAVFRHKAHSSEDVGVLRPAH